MDQLILVPKMEVLVIQELVAVVVLNLVAMAIGIIQVIVIRNVAVVHVLEKEAVQNFQIMIIVIVVQMFKEILLAVIQQRVLKSQHVLLS